MSVQFTSPSFRVTWAYNCGIIGCMANKLKSIEVGTQFGYWTTFGETFLRGRADGRQRAWVTCTCKCGTDRDVCVANLLSGKSQSCGCLHRELASLANTTHGARKGQTEKHPNPPLYNTWKGIKERCRNPKAQNYRWYGGRGIDICNEWYNDFAAFRAWSELNGYEPGFQIDRINNELGYSPSNCRWITRLENLKNKRAYLPVELETKLQNYAKDNGREVYAVITEALEKFLGEVK